MFKCLYWIRHKAKKYITEKMPQLVPFDFINQVTIGFILLIFMVYIFSKYILPKYIAIYLTRIYISKFF